jgi:hypothetical protein
VVRKSAATDKYTDELNIENEVDQTNDEKKFVRSHDPATSMVCKSSARKSPSCFRENFIFLKKIFSQENIKII